MEVKTTVKPKRTEKPKHEVDELIKKARKEAEKLVKGYFEFTEAQGGWIDFSVRLFPGDPIQTFHIVHGETCELPMGIVKILNNCRKVCRQYDMKDMKDQTNPVRPPRVLEKTSRMKFTPVEFY